MSMNTIFSFDILEYGNLETGFDIVDKKKTFNISIL